MNKISMSMLMSVSHNGAKEKTRTSTVKKVREMRHAQRLSLNENAMYQTLWNRPNPFEFKNGQGIGKEARTQDFSNGGIGLLTSEPLQPMEIIQIELNFSDTGVTI